MKHEKLHKLILAALFAALTCVATNLVVPVPMLHGYVNLGDCMVLLGAFLLGPVYGAAAGGIGSMLADLLLGYLTYAPGTLIIKALMAVSAALLLKALREKTGDLAATVVGGLAAEGIMVFGYFAYEAALLGYGLSAAASMPGNSLQGAAGLVFGCILYHALYHIPAVKRAVRAF